MGTLQDKVIEIMRSKGRPMTAVEISRLVFPDAPSWELSVKKTKIYNCLVRMEKYDEVRKGAMLDNQRLWVLV